MVVVCRTAQIEGVVAVHCFKLDEVGGEGTVIYIGDEVLLDEE